MKVNMAKAGIKVRPNTKSLEGQDILSEIKVEYNEEEDKNDEEETLSPQFTVRCFPEEPEEPAQVTFKSIQKSMLFSGACGHLAKMMRKSASITIGNVTAIVLDTKKGLACVETTLEVSHKDERGNARLKIWGPRQDGKRKDCTVQVLSLIHI